MFLAKLLLGLPLLVLGTLSVFWPNAMTVHRPWRWRSYGMAAVIAGIAILAI